MFQLREQHIQAMETVAEDNFVERGVLHLRTAFPDATSSMTDESLRARVRNGMSRARMYGLDTEQQIMCFVDSGMILGEAFDSNPNHDWARQILDRRQYPAEVRSQSLLLGATRWAARPNAPRETASRE